jgi:TPR repeat protein
MLLIMGGCALPGSVPDTAEFRQLMEKADAGDPDSQYRLGLKYTIASEWAWDHARGYRWFTAAVARGHADAQYMCGMAKLLGRGTPYDEAGAVELFGRAARQGQVRAQYQLGLAYLDGRGVAKDRPWGRQWLEQAAWNGHREAQFMLGALFAKGVGGQRNPVEAWRWLDKARRGGQANSSAALERLVASMSAAEVAAAEALLAQQARIDEDGLWANPMIRYVQTMLNRTGYGAGEEDGQYGPRTGAAVAAFLMANAMPAETRITQVAETLRSRY